MTENAFTIAHATFAGPLDALLALIESKKMEVSDISLAEVAEDFAQYVEENNSLTLHDRSAAIVILATLMLIKSRALLPSFALTDEEELAADELQKRLRLYAEIKKGAAHIAPLWRTQPLLGMQRTPIRTIVFAPSSDLTLTAVHQALRTLTHALPAPQKHNEAHVKAVVRIEDMMDNIAQRIQRAASDSFKNMTAGTDKATVIVSFLAILELVRNGVLRVQQESRFGDIALHHDSE